MFDVSLAEARQRPGATFRVNRREAGKYVETTNDDAHVILTSRSFDSRLHRVGGSVLPAKCSSRWASATKSGLDITVTNPDRKVQFAYLNATKLQSGSTQALS